MWKNAFVCFHHIVNWPIRIKFLRLMSDHLIRQLLQTWSWRTVKIKHHFAMHSNCTDQRQVQQRTALLLFSNWSWALASIHSAELTADQYNYQVNAQELLLLHFLLLSICCATDLWLTNTYNHIQCMWIIMWLQNMPFIC